MTAALSPWNAAAASLLKQFLDSGAGRHFLDHLVNHRPALLSGSDINSVALRASECAGFEKALQAIASLASPPPEISAQESSNYPDLDDDSAWPKTEAAK